ncbi:hypothetical protein ACLOJK_027890 [Asimina triloba]
MAGADDDSEAEKVVFNVIKFELSRNRLSSELKGHGSCYILNSARTSRSLCTILLELSLEYARGRCDVIRGVIGRIRPSAPSTTFIFHASHPNAGDSNEGFITVSPICARVHWLSVVRALNALTTRALCRLALFSVCVCVLHPYEHPYSPSVSYARPSLVARCVYGHPPFSGSLAFRIFPSSPLRALRPCSPSAFRPSSSRAPLLSVCVSPVSARRLQPSRLPNHDHRPFSISLVFLPFPSSPLRLQPPSPFSDSLASCPSLLARCVFPPTAILPSPAVSSSRPSLLACCVIPWFVHPAFSGRLVFPSTIDAFCLQSLDAVKRICPKQALFIGMTHESDHHKDNEFLEEWSRRFE